MPIISLKDIKYVEAQLDHVKNYKKCLDDLLSDEVNSGERALVAASAAYVILKESILELVKNSLDAGATELCISIHLLDLINNTVEIAVTDNGSGFAPGSSLGKYPTCSAAVGYSPKAGDATKLGGAHKGNLQASYALKQNGGHLWRENIFNAEQHIIGAKLVFCSSLAPCCYTIVKYQSEFCTPKSSMSPETAVSKLAVQTMLGGSFSSKYEAMKRRVAEAKAKEAAMLCESLGAAEHSSLVPMCDSFDASISGCLAVSDSDSGLSSRYSLTPVLPGASPSPGSSYPPPGTSYPSGRPPLCFRWSAEPTTSTLAALPGSILFAKSPPMTLHCFVGSDDLATTSPSHNP